MSYLTKLKRHLSEQDIADHPESLPTKPPKGASVSYVINSLAQLQNIDGAVSSTDVVDSACGFPIFNDGESVCLSGDFCQSPPCSIPTKPPKAPFVSFGSSVLGPIENIAANDAALASRGWMIHYANGDAVESYFSPSVTHSQLMALRPDAIAAEPIVEPMRQPVGLSESDESAVMKWLAHIGETDPEIVDDVLSRCRCEPDALAYFISQSSDIRPQDSTDDDRRRCTQCCNLRQGVCSVAKPAADALVIANRGYRPDQTRLMRCEGYAPKPSDPDQQTGMERWPGLRRTGW